jgi:predicted ATPase/DNA-binding XRE family transcriptional regulator
MAIRTPSQFGSLLRTLRVAAALSQEALAERAGLSVRGLSDLERGVHREPRLETARMLATALKLSEAQRVELLNAARPERIPITPTSAECMVTALPISPTRLVGRVREVAELRRVLTDHTSRLVTLTGPGGSGKTRLAQAVAASLQETFPDGVYLVDLAPLSDQSLVLPQIAEALGVREGGGLLHDALTSHLSGKRVLLFVDNFEHVLTAAPAVTSMLATATGLKILATSRASLSVRGEQEFPVPPLQLPDLSRLTPLDELAEIEAVTLFVQRAQAVRPNFALSAENARTVTAICIQLDGLPLAIELAATRVKLLPPAELLARLEHRLPLLTGGARDLPERQQTLRATIAWSYNLLDLDEQWLFRLLAVFVGGTTLEALEIVAGHDGHLEVFAALTGLVEQSLLRRVERPGDAPRFRMLETVREYALEELARSGEAEEARRRHALWCLSLGERVAHQGRPALLGNPRDVAELEAEYANLWAALTWLTQAGESGVVLRLAAALGGFWNLRRHRGDGQLWLEQALAQDDGTQPRERAGALVWLGMLMQSERTFALLDEAETLAREAGDTVVLASATLSRAFAIFHSLGDTVLATALGEESLALYKEANVPWGIAAAHLILAKAAQRQGDWELATARYEQILADFRKQGGDEYIAAQTFQSLASLAQARGDDARALPFYAEALNRFNDLGDLGSVAWCLEGVAAASGPEHPELAARLFAAADTLRKVINVPLTPAELPEYDRLVDRVRVTLNASAFDECWLRGAALPLEMAMAEARLLASVP